MTNRSYSTPWVTLLLRLFVAPAVVVLLGGAVFAQKTYLYVESNKGRPASLNSVFAFSNDGLGNLTALPGSPYLTGGTGVYASGGSQFNADQEVIANPAGTLLYAVNGTSNTVSGFAINADGTLTTLPGSPFPSGGQNPVSIGLSGAFMVVANKNEDPNQDNSGTVPNYSTFRVDANGSLTLNTRATVDLPVGSSPAQALVWGKGRIVFGLEYLTSRIASYSFDKRGTMMELTSVGPPSVGAKFLGEILHPRKKALYAGILNRAQVAVYLYDDAGLLSFVRTVPNGGADICWLKTNAAGTRLYTSESLSRTISVYDLTDYLNPVLLQQVTVNDANGPVTNIALDPTEDFLYALAGTTIRVLNLDDSGLMSQIVSPIPLPGLVKETPLGLEVVRK